MSIDEMNQAWRRRPFVPYRVHVSDGRSYEVYHPEVMHLSQTTLIISLFDPNQDPTHDVASRDVRISPLHVTSVEELPARGTTNGEAA